MPDFNDKLNLYPQEALKQAAKNNLNNCCRLCGEPAQYTTACPCSLTTAQQVALKDAKRRFTTPS
jgi:GTP cyclohydrolase FolE2